MDMRHEMFQLLSDPVPVKIRRMERTSGITGCDFHWHEQLEIYYIRSGGVNLLCNGVHRWFYPDDVAVVNWCEPHKSIQFLDDTLHYVIQIDLNAPPFEAVGSGCAFPSFIHGNREVNHVLDRIIQEYEQRKNGFEFVLAGEVMKLAGLLVRASGNGIARQNNRTNLTYVKQIFSFIHDNFSRDITLEELAKTLNITPSHLCRIFKKHTGVTVVQYVNNLRFHYAVSLLSQGVSVTEASYLVGFHDHNYFSRSFKKAMGSPPAKYMKKSLDKLQK